MHDFSQQEDSTVKIVKLKMAGRSYVLKVKSDQEEQYYLELAKYVEGVLEKIKRGTGVKDYKSLLLLTCFSLADEIINPPKANEIPSKWQGGGDLDFKERLGNILNKLSSHRE